MKDNHCLIAPQPRLGAVGLTALLILANALIPFSLDIYTPAVPEMPAHFQTSEAMVNLTILGFYVFFAIGLLLFGPLSDKYGRKPILVSGFIAYIAGSLLCSVATSIVFLILSRIVQALGAGAVNAVSVALVKDCFVSARRGALLAIIQVFTIVGPIIAPLLGGVMLEFASWRVIFLVLAAMGGVCLVASLLFKECLEPEERLQAGVLHSLSGLVRISRMRKFMLILTVVSLFNLPFMAYVAVGSYIYVDFFGETQQAYTYFFAATAGFSILGPAFHLRFGKNLSPYRFTYVLIAVGIICGIALLLMGVMSVWVFMALMMIFALLEATIRPYTTDMLLTLASRDVGSASAMINFLYTALGAVGMMVIMLPFPNYVFGLGVIVLVSMVVALPLWIGACGKNEEDHW